MDQENILQALKKTGGEVFGNDGAAQLLGTPPTTLVSRIKKINIRPSGEGGG